MSHELHFDCPNCRGPLSALVSDAGTAAVCSHCAREVTVPGSKPACFLDPATNAAQGCGLFIALLIGLFVILPISLVLYLILTAALQR